MHKKDEVYEIVFRDAYNYNIIRLCQSNVENIKDNTNKSILPCNAINIIKSTKLNNLASSSGFSSEHGKNVIHATPRNRPNKSGKITIGFDIPEPQKSNANDDPSEASAESGVCCLAHNPAEETIIYKHESDSYYTCSDHKECLTCVTETTNQDKNHTKNMDLADRRLSM